VQPRRATNATRLTLIGLAQVIDWRPVLTIVQPDTLIRWHRHAFRLFWRWKSRPRGRPRIPADVQQLIADIAKAKRTWGEERIAAELLLKLGIALSPRTVGRYMRRPRTLGPRLSTRTWSTFVRNHARELLACDFFVTVTARFHFGYGRTCSSGPPRPAWPKPVRWQVYNKFPTTGRSLVKSGT